MSDECIPPKQEPTATAEVKYVFPDLEKGPAVFYDDETNCVWFGIPFSKVNDPMFVVTTIDGAKTAILANLMKFHARMNQRNKLSLGGKVKQSFADLCEKANKLITK